MNWLALVLLPPGLALLGWSVARRITSKPAIPGIIAWGAVLSLIGAGGIASSAGLLDTLQAGYILLGFLGALVLMFLVLVVTGEWITFLGYLAAAGILFHLGAWTIPAIAEALAVAGQFVWSVTPLEPSWLVLLLLIPALVWFSFRSLAGLGPIRRVVALGLRSLLILLLVLALAETHARKPEDNLTVLFLYDRSLSIPPEINAENQDEREDRIFRFINDSVAKRGGTKQGDRAGVIVFGRQPRLELPPANVPTLGFKKIRSPVDDTYTDIASAIKLALASFPEGTSKRIVLISDGNENIGQAEEQARIAKQNGVQIDVVPLGSGKRNINEVLVERIEAPSTTEKDSNIPLRIILRSFHPQFVVGTLELFKESLESALRQPGFEKKPILSTTVKLRPGLNVFYYQQPGAKKEDAVTYEAKFEPKHVEDKGGNKVQADLRDDRKENNRASVSVMSRGQRAILLLEPKVGDHQLLVNRLQKAKSSLRIMQLAPKDLPQDPLQLSLFLNRFDCVILANMPAESRDGPDGEIVGLTEDQQKVLRSQIHDQGVGFIMIGGPQSFGAGGWQGSELEKAMPVTSDLKSIKVEGKSGLVLIMHASEIAEGNAWQKKIAKIAVEKLSPMDMVGLVYYDHGLQGPGGHIWHIPFQEIADRRRNIIARLDSMVPGDMPDAEPALTMAYKELTKQQYGLGTKHIIFISDGDHWAPPIGILQKIKAAKITCTTVCVTSHGNSEIQRMQFVAQMTGGRSYHVKDPSQLPAIYIKESRLVSQSFVHEKPFTPQLMSRFGPTEGLNDLENLYGFVRTSRRPSPLVSVPIQSPKLGETKFPILAYWQYGLGKSIAFTSDARSQLEAQRNFWDKDWAGADMYAKFWEQTVDFSLRPVDSGKYLHVTTEHKDGKVRITLEANDTDGKKTPITDFQELKAGVTSPSLKDPEAQQVEIRFEQKSAGVYEAEFQADEVGAYFLSIRAKWRKGNEEFNDTVRAGVTIPYSPEFAEMESNLTLLDKLKDATGGNRYADDSGQLKAVAESGAVFRANPISHQSLQPLWYWLVLLAGICLLFDVAVRRIAFEPAVAYNHAVAIWSRLRRQSIPETTTVFLERLQSRKAKVGEGLEKKKAAKRFEAAEGASTAPIPDATAAPTSSTPLPRKPAPSAKKKEEDAADFATRLMRAKKKAMEERDREA